MFNAILRECHIINLNFVCIFHTRKKYNWLGAFSIYLLLARDKAAVEDASKNYVFVSITELIITT